MTTPDAATILAPVRASIASGPLRHSALKRMAQSPAHYAAAVEQSSAAMTVGSAADALVLGKQDVAVYPGAVRRGKEYEAFARANFSTLIVTAKEYEQAAGIRDAIDKHPEAKRLLTGIVQETLITTMQGRLVRGTPDVRDPAGRFLTDLKTGETSDPRRFGWKVRRFAYHAQLAWYRDIIERCGHKRPAECYIVAVESTAPYVVTVFKLTEHVLELGDRLNRTWFEQLMVCEASGLFPGYSQSNVDLDLSEDSDGEEIVLEDAGTDAPE